MFGKEKRRKEEESERAQDSVFTAASQPIPPRPTVLEILKAKRAQKVALVIKLREEIAQDDQDITYAELNPHHARMLNKIAERFELDNMPNAGYDARTTYLDEQMAEVPGTWRPGNL